ncbi:unnamed protein product, partial [marine sediment metagenome]
WQSPLHQYSSLRTSEYKLIWDWLSDTVQLFALEADPNELSDISGQRPEVVSTMLGTLRQIVDMATRDEQSEATVMTDPESAAVEERLRALGYL